MHLTGVSLESIQADAAHPNKMKVRGVLVRLDEASDKPPNGAMGHRILVPTDVAKRRLRTLVGMGLNYAADLDGHAQQHKVGVITKAWIDGKDLRVEGHVWKRDFPEAEKDLKQPDLGMSMELGNVSVEDPHANVWVLADFTFLGATILWRDSAAYTDTQAIAARAEQRRNQMSTKRTPTKKPTRKPDRSSTDKVTDIAIAAASGAVAKHSKGVLKAIETQTAVLSGMAASMEHLSARVEALEEGGVAVADVDTAAASSATSTASSTASEDDGSMETARRAAATSSATSTASSTTSEEENVDAETDTGDLEQEEKDGNAGHANEDAEHRGEDGAADEITKVGKTVASAREKALRSQLKAERKKRTKLEASVSSMQEDMKKLRKQVSAAAERTGRKSFSPEMRALLSKSNIDPTDLLRSGQKLTVAEVDGILNASGVNLKPEDRMSIKNGFLHQGLMEEGRVDRNYR